MITLQMGEAFFSSDPKGLSSQAMLEILVLISFHVCFEDLVIRQDKSVSRNEQMFTRDSFLCQIINRKLKVEGSIEILSG